MAKSDYVDLNELQGTGKHFRKAQSQSIPFYAANRVGKSFDRTVLGKVSKRHYSEPVRREGGFKVTRSDYVASFKRGPL
jgi:hypothetical protein